MTSNDQLKKLCDNLYVLQGGINTGILISGGRAALFNCGDNLTTDILASIGVQSVEKVFCTQYRRTTAGGIYGFAEKGAEIAVPVKEAELFTNVEEYWEDPANRWHIYHYMPDTDVLPYSVKPVCHVCGGDTIYWGSFEISVYEAPGSTHGGVSYAVRVENTDYSFCGDLIYGDGQILNLYSMARPNGELTGYHGFMGSRNELLSSLKHIADISDIIIPPHGPVVSNPGLAVSLLEECLDKIYLNYISISSMNFYFPGLLTESIYAPFLMEKAEILEIPEFIRQTGYPSFIIVSDDGAAFLIDCGAGPIVTMLEKWLSDGIISSVDGCWVTHYHDDHVDALGFLKERLGTTIYCSRELADIIERPNRHFLPCISPTDAPVTIMEEGTSLQWHEFRFTMFHFPGQSLYHGGLLLEGHGIKVLFAGDSGSPCGLDDYCPQNRNFLGKDRGSRKTLELIRKFRPGYILNQHQQRAFRFTDKQLDFMEHTLAERELIYSRLFPWPSPDYGLDEHWLRAYPYEQVSYAGQTADIELHVTNHAEKNLEIFISPILPSGWTCEGMDSFKATLPALSYGIAGQGFDNGDGVIPFRFVIPADTCHKRYIVPFAVTLDDVYYGWLKHVIIDIKGGF